MRAQLPLEIYGRIIQHIMSSEGDAASIPKTQMRESFGLRPTALRRGNQSSLANFMQVSKAVYDTCKNELYKDCLVGDIATFAQDIDTNPRKVELLAHVKSLRLYHGNDRASEEPAYIDLILDDEWAVSGRVSTSDDCFLAMYLALDRPKFAHRFLLGPTFEALQEASIPTSKSQGAFSSLERVVMTREVESFPWGVQPEELQIFNLMLRPPPIPLFLVNLPSVKHYCQLSPTGPLALGNHTLKIDHPPEVVTNHHPGLFLTLGAPWLPAIILGSTNRFMCNGPKVMLSSDVHGTISPADLARSLIPLEVLFNREAVLHVEPERHTAVPFDSVSLEGTKIEIYDYIRHFTVSRTGHRTETVERYPTDLSVIQSLLDEKLGRWKGKVVLKNREDCPPCSACGFEGYWKYN